MRQRVEAMSGGKTLFSKYMWTIMLIILISFVLLGTMVVTFVSEYWKNEKSELLLKNANSISGILSGHSEKFGESIYIYDKDIIKSFISAVGSNINAEIFIADRDGNIILCSEGLEGHYRSKKISEGIMDKVFEGNYDCTGNMEGIYEEEYYIVGTPVIRNGSGRINQLGAVFISSKLGTFVKFRIDVLKAVAIASLIAMFISFWSVRFLSYNMTKPLREMSEAAVCMGRGDFSKRVSVKSDDEIGELARTFNNMAESLCISENAKSSFISNVSHEFKTPMTTIAGFIDGILDGTVSEEKHEYYLKIVSSEIKRLSRLVKTMLDLSRIDSNGLKIDRKEFSITGIIIDILISFEKTIKDKNIEILGLSSCEDISINGDRDMIYQVVYNLIENAIKFTNMGGEIELRLYQTFESCHFSLKNTGAGISKDEIGYIFDRFYKTDKSRSEDKNGMGLGLYIVKKIVNLHGGDITVESEPGDYTRFEFWIPRTSQK